MRCVPRRLGRVCYPIQLLGVCAVIVALWDTHPVFMPAALPLPHDYLRARLAVCHCFHLHLRMSRDSWGCAEQPFQIQIPLMCDVLCARPSRALSITSHIHPVASIVAFVVCNVLTHHISRWVHHHPRRTMAHAQFLAERPPDGNISDNSQLRNVRVAVPQRARSMC